MKSRYSILIISVSFFYVGLVSADGWDPDSDAGNRVSIGITDTRHNMTMSYSPSQSTMNSARNDYGEVCVYCHTPHRASTHERAAGLPLWNRTQRANDYALYAALTMQQVESGNPTVNEPGPNSVSCLSCHDGVTAIDSIINIPGSDRYEPMQETEVSLDFLNNEWPFTSTYMGKHASLKDCTTGCHNVDNNFVRFDFSAFVIGNMESSTVDLRDDHPVGIRYPTGAVDYRVPTGEIPGSLLFFDNINTNNRPDKGELRLYANGGNYEVQCASCHDPHGVPDSSGLEFIPSFLRVSNEGSALCFSCHIK